MCVGLSTLHKTRSSFQAVNKIFGCKRSDCNDRKLSLLFIGKIIHRRDMPNITIGCERSLIDDVFIFVGAT
jgi:hypothetical protein